MRSAAVALFLPIACYSPKSVVVLIQDAGFEAHADDRGAQGTGGVATGGGGGTTAGGTGGVAGGGGSSAGTGGLTAGTGGLTAGTGGFPVGTGGLAAGTGGLAAGTGGFPSGTGGTAGGTPPCVRFVNASAPAGGDGTSWSSALADVQAGIDAARAADPALCQVWVAAGTYRAWRAAATDTFRVPAGVELYGGFAGGETSRDARDWVARPTVLEGAAAAGSQRVYHVVTTTGGVIDGFTIRGGAASGAAPHDQGGGIFGETGAPAMRHLVVTGNSAAGSGGGARFIAGSLTIEDSTFSGNRAGVAGGALQLDADAVLSRSTITRNIADDDAGGVGLGRGRTTVVNCVFSGNMAVDYAGGLAAGPEAEARIMNNTFFDNHAPHGGGGFTVNNNGTIAANNVALSNTGLYGPNILLFNGKTSPIHHNCGNGGMSGTDNVDANPQLVDAAAGDFRLAPASPCIDRADDTLAPPADMSGRLRIDIPAVGSSTADIGALEHWP